MYQARKRAKDVRFLYIAYHRTYRERKCLGTNIVASSPARFSFPVASAYSLPRVRVVLDISLIIHYIKICYSNEI